MILNSETLDNLTACDHYRNLLKILDWDGYSRWDEHERQKLHFLSNYKQFVIEKSNKRGDFFVGSSFNKFCQEVL